METTEENKMQLYIYTLGIIAFVFVTRYFVKKICGGHTAE
jgi:hypothetical protein